MKHHNKTPLEEDICGFKRNPTPLKEDMVNCQLKEMKRLDMERNKNLKLPYMETKTNRIRSKSKDFVKKPTPSAAYLNQTKKPQRKSTYSPHSPKYPTRKAQESFTMDMKDTQHPWQSPNKSKTYFEIPSLEELEKIGISSYEELEKIGISSYEELEKIEIPIYEELEKIEIPSLEDLEQEDFNHEEWQKNANYWLNESRKKTENWLNKIKATKPSKDYGKEYKDAKHPAKKAQESFTKDMMDTQYTWKPPSKGITYKDKEPPPFLEDTLQDEILNQEWIRNWSKETKETKHSIQDGEEVKLGEPTETMPTNQEPTTNDSVPSTSMEEPNSSTNQDGTMHQKNRPLEELEFEIDPGYQTGSAQFCPKIDWNNKIDTGYIDGSAVFKPKVFILDEPNKKEENDRYCPNGIKNCPYIVCEVTRNKTPRPVYGFPQMTSCGKSYKSEFCTHEHCHDTRLRLAAGDSYALRAQLKLNKTGIYNPVPPLHYKEELNRIIITKDLVKRQSIIDIANINWEKEELTLYIREGGETTAEKPFQHIKFDSDSEKIKPPKQWMMSDLMNKQPTIDVANINWEQEELTLYINEGRELSTEKPFQQPFQPIKIDSDSEKIRPPKKWMMSSMMASFQAYCTSKLIDIKMTTTDRFITNLKNYPFTLFNLMYITLLILAFSIPYAMGKEKQVSNFVYEPVREDLIINARYLYSGTRWVPCDLLGAKATMSDLIAAEEEICNTELIWDHLEGNELIKDTDDHYTLLQGEHNAKTAEKLCQTIGSSVIEIRNTTEILPLQKFMGKHAIKSAWAGLDFDDQLEEVTFKSDKRMATWRAFPDIQYFYKGERDTLSWNDALYYHKHRKTHISDGNFIYKNSGQSIELWIRYENSPYRRPNKRSQPWDYGAVSVLPVICKRKTRQSSISKENYKNWKDSCKNNLKILTEKVNAANYKISQVLPEALPSTFERLSPFLYMDQLEGKKKRPVNNTKTEPNLMLDAQSSWNALIDQEKKSTVTQCMDHYEKEGKRMAPLLAAGAIVSTVFSATKFFVRMLPLLKQKIKEAKGESENKEEGILYAIKDISTNTNQMMAIQRQLNNHANMSYILSTQDEIRDSLTTILDYVDQVYNKITTLVYVESYKPKNPLEFMTKRRFEEIITHVHTKFNENLLNDISKTITFIANSRSSFLIATAIPFIEDSIMASLYRIHKLPTITDGYQTFPKTEAEYMAVSKHDNSFIPISKNLATTCIKKGHCSSTQSTFKSEIDICGYTNFWKNTQICEYERTNIKRPYYLVIGNRTYFSVGKKPTRITIKCKAKILNQPGKNQVEQIRNMGSFELSDSCYAQSGLQTMRPGQRNLEMPGIPYKETKFLVNQANLKNQPKYVQVNGEHYKAIHLEQDTPHNTTSIAKILTIIILIMVVILLATSPTCIWYFGRQGQIDRLGCCFITEESDEESGHNPTQPAEKRQAIEHHGNNIDSEETLSIKDKESKTIENNQNGTRKANPKTGTDGKRAK